MWRKIRQTNKGFTLPHGDVRGETTGRANSPHQRAPPSRCSASLLRPPAHPSWLDGAPRASHTTNLIDVWLRTRPRGVRSINMKQYAVAFAQTYMHRRIESGQTSSVHDGTDGQSGRGPRRNYTGGCAPAQGQNAISSNRATTPSSMSPKIDMVNGKTKWMPQDSKPSEESMGHCSGWCRTQELIWQQEFLCQRVRLQIRR